MKLFTLSHLTLTDIWYVVATCHIIINTLFNSLEVAKNMYIYICINVFFLNAAVKYSYFRRLFFKLTESYCEMKEKQVFIEKNIV